MNPTHSLSPAAVDLLAVLRRLHARNERTAVVDRELAAALGVNPRVVSDVADELLTHGYLVVASGRGRWLVEIGDRLDAARDYERSLRDRAVAVFARAGHVRSAIERHELAGPVGQTGQGVLFCAG